MGWQVPARVRMYRCIPVALALAGLLALGVSSAGAATRTVAGKVESGNRILAGVQVKAYRSGGANGKPKLLAAGRTNRGGKFRLRVREPRNGDAVVYMTVGRRGAIQLAATLGSAPLPGRVVIDELTTAATGFAFAQFIKGRRIAGPSPGPRNAALMAANLADARRGKVAEVLRTSPNGGETSTLATFKSVANMLPRCARSEDSCARLFRLTATPDGRTPRGVLQAVANIAKYPWQNVRRLALLARSAPAPYKGALTAKQVPAAWTMPLRFVGDGETLDGPGNTAFDAEGRAYVANNYEFGADPFEPVCGSDLLPVFEPDGSYAPGTPLQGGGLSGAGYGVTLDPAGDIWVSNFGFAAPSPGCPDDRQPPHNSVSQFHPDGTAASPATGWVAGDIFWPQGTVSDEQGTIWIANCGNGMLTRMPGDDPLSAVGIDVGLEEAFDVVVNNTGKVLVTGLGNSKLAVVHPDGTPVQGSPFDSAELGLDRPMGIALDSRGNAWIANSSAMNLPCPDLEKVNLQAKDGSLSLLGKGLKPRTSEGNVFKGGGLTLAWGIAVDGNDNVWVSNFNGRRVSHFCGVRRKACRPGSVAGDPISPDDTGYFFNGFTRLTSVEIDPSGNVWVTNNWKRIPIQSNPGGLEMVVMVGAAAPVRTPLIGPPDPLLR